MYPEHEKRHCLDWHNVEAPLGVENNPQTFFRVKN